jgi:hypothetical protein
MAFLALIDIGLIGSLIAAVILDRRSYKNSMKPQTLFSHNQASYGTIISKNLERATNASERPT